MSGNEPSDAIRVVNALLTQIDQIKRSADSMVTLLSFFLPFIFLSSFHCLFHLFIILKKINLFFIIIIFLLLLNFLKLLLLLFFYFLKLIYLLIYLFNNTQTEGKQRR